MDGKSVMCTRNREFTIRGIEDCLARGYDRSGFFEVDTRRAKELDGATHRRAGPHTAMTACRNDGVTKVHPDAAARQNAET